MIWRFLDFDRFEIKIAMMTANILSKDYGIELKGKSAIDVSPDIHLKRVMYRLGLIDEIEDVVFSRIPLERVTYATRSINPEFLDLMDLLFWEIGQQKI